MNPTKWLTDLVGGSVDKIIDSVGNTLDELFTSDDERNKASILLNKVQNALKLELGKQALEYDKEVTARWKSDNENLVTRMVRPMMVIWTYVLFSAVMLADGNLGDFAIKEAYIPLLETIIVTITIAYFGSRGFEKTTKYIKGK